MPDNSMTFVANPVDKGRISRSKHDLGHTWTGTALAGKLNCFLGYSLVLPNSTYKVSTKLVIRSTTPVQATMDQLYCDVYYFFVPHKMVLNRASMSSATNDAQHSFEAFIGAQDSNINYPVPSATSLPKWTVRQSNYTINSLADQLGIPCPAVANTSISIEPFEVLSYWSVWNNYFRDPSTMSPVTYNLNNGYLSASGGVYYWNGGDDVGLSASGNNAAIGTLLPVCRYHSYFGSGLPWPQRSNAGVTLPLGETAPVYLFNNNTVSIPNNSNIHLGAAVPANSKTSSFMAGDYTTSLKVDLEQATAATVNQLRLATAQQRWLETLARSGNRIDEITKAMFDVTPHDAISDKPEYLGGKHIKLNMTQVTSNTVATDAGESVTIGSTGGFSLTADSDYYFTKSFDTWGTIIGVFCIRPHESFCQGLHKRFFKFNREDYYWKQFANLGEQPVLEKEIYLSGNASSDDSVFSYMPAWSEYRYLPDVVTGHMKPTAANNISYWNYCNNFSSAPTLKGYLNGDNLKNNVDQTLQVLSSTAGFQFMCQFGMDITAVLPIPVYSDPGLLDHN